MGAHMAGIEPSGKVESWYMTLSLMGWATRTENTVSVEWKGVGIWLYGECHPFFLHDGANDSGRARDNTAVMHHAAGGSHEPKYPRDLRRTTVHDASTTQWRLNEKADTRPGSHSNGKEHISFS